MIKMSSFPLSSDKWKNFYIVCDDGLPNSWVDVVWSDAKELGATLQLSSHTLPAGLLASMRHIHFANVLNHKIWLPLKCIWDKTNSLQPHDLSTEGRNYVIFQTGIKFSATSIAALKRERNACIVLYMPDNIRTMGIARTRLEFDRFVKHYHIDQVYSFDPKDCEEFGCHFFDYYSAISAKITQTNTTQVHMRKRVLYVGSCRSAERLKIVHALYKKLRSITDCTFYLNGVPQNDCLYDGIYYNHPLNYLEVIDLVQSHDVIVEIMNGTQSGNTLRTKEAVCYNKLLLTDNQQVRNSHYFNPQYMQVFTTVDDVDLTTFSEEVNYHYDGEFSPVRLMNLIIENDIL